MREGFTELTGQHQVIRKVLDRAGSCQEMIASSPVLHASSTVLHTSEERPNKHDLC